MLYFLGLGVVVYFFLWVIVLVADAYFELVTIPRWRRVANGSNMTGKEVADRLISAANMDIIVETQPQRTRDSYDARSNKLLLTHDTGTGVSVAAMTAAAQGVAQAQQQREAYAPALWSNILSRPLRIAFVAAFVILIVASLLRSPFLVYVAGAVIAVYPLFLLTAIPAALDANRRARAMLQSAELLRPMDSTPLDDLMRAAVVSYLARAMGRVQEWNTPTPNAPSVTS
jgi:Zn-dependent membrane protease YugP